MKAQIKMVLGMFGYEVKRKAAFPETFDNENDFDREAQAQIARIRAHSMLPYVRLHSLYAQAVYCERAGIAGGFVECGVWKGGAMGLMALANQAHGRARRELHLFDSFAGIPEPDEAVDGARAVGEARAAGGGTQGRLVALANLYESDGTLDVNRALLEDAIGYDPAHVHFHAGWFQNTLPRDAASLGPIAILRLDGDWYASTKICLDHLFDRVVAGGFVIVDDYGRYEGCRRATDEFLRARGIETFLHRIDSEARYWIKA
jgi:O-methyltransferase